MKAILTKYLPATNHRPSRITAFDGNGHRVTISYDSNLDHHEEPHRKAALALCKKMDWPGVLVGGGTKDGWAFCFLEASPEAMAMRAALVACVDRMAELQERTNYLLAWPRVQASDALAASDPSRKP